MKKEILLFLTDEWCDWEASYAIAVANAFSDYEVKTIALDKLAKKSMGGLKTQIDYSVSDYQNLDEVAMVILPGGLSWDDRPYDEIAAFITKVRAKHIPVAAICAATTFLCRQGFLNSIHHTGDSKALFLEQPGYKGEAFYVEAQIVVDDGIITANETAAVAFAYEIFKILGIDSEEERNEWVDRFQNGQVRPADGVEGK